MYKAKVLLVQGEAQREVVRVTVDCCLQERAWNGYYAQLLASLVRTVKGHRITLQFCLWDLIKQVPAPSLTPCASKMPYQAFDGSTVNSCMPGLSSSFAFAQTRHMSVSPICCCPP